MTSDWEAIQEVRCGWNWIDGSGILGQDGGTLVGCWSWCGSLCRHERLWSEASVSCGPRQHTITELITMLVKQHRDQCERYVKDGGPVALSKEAGWDDVV